MTWTEPACATETRDVVDLKAPFRQHDLSPRLSWPIARQPRLSYSS